MQPELSQLRLEALIRQCRLAYDNDNTPTPESMATHAKFKVSIPDYVWALPTIGHQATLKQVQAWAEAVAYRIRCPDGKRITCQVPHRPHGRLMFVGGERVRVTTFVFLMAFSLFGCAFGGQNDGWDRTSTIAEVKQNCADQTIDLRSYTSTTACENDGFRIIGARRLSPDAYERFSNYLDRRLAIAKATDNGEINETEIAAALRSAEDETVHGSGAR